MRLLRDECSADELNYVLCHLNLPKLIYSCRSDELMQLLLVESVPSYVPLTRAVVVDACEKVFVQALLFTPWAAATCELIIGSTADELTVMKAVLDSGADHHNLYKLVHSYIPQVSDQMYRRVLAHLTNPDGTNTKLQRLTSLENKIISGNGLKLLSDMDDTLACSGGSFPKGCDTRFPKHEVYPGLLQVCISLRSHLRSASYYSCLVLVEP